MIFHETLWSMNYIEYYIKNNYFQAEAVETPEMKKCREKCEGQMWDKGFDDMINPCGSLFNSLSITILFIISLVR